MPDISYLILLINVFLLLVIFVVLLKKTNKQKKLIKDLQRDLIHNEYNVIDKIWKTKGATENLIKRMEYNNDSLFQWLRLPPRIWLVYLSSLIEKNRDAEAKEVLNLYTSRFGESLIDQYILVANFAINNGIGLDNEKIIKSKKVCNYFEGIERGGDFTKIF